MNTPKPKHNKTNYPSSLYTSIPDLDGGAPVATKKQIRQKKAQLITDKQKTQKKIQETQKRNNDLTIFKNDYQARSHDLKDLLEKRKKYMDEQKILLTKEKEAKKERYKAYQSQERKLTIDEKERALKLIEQEQEQKTSDDAVDDVPKQNKNNFFVNLYKKIVSFCSKKK